MSGVNFIGECSDLCYFKSFQDFKQFKIRFSLPNTGFFHQIQHWVISIQRDLNAPPLTNGIEYFMLNAVDTSKFVTHAYNAIIDVMDKKLKPQEIF